MAIDVSTSGNVGADVACARHDRTVALHGFDKVAQVRREHMTDTAAGREADMALIS